MNRFMQVQHFLAIFLAVLLVSGCSSGASTIYGTAWHDGQPVPEAKIVLTGDNNFKIVTFADNFGDYIFVNVPPGSYMIGIEDTETGKFVSGEGSSIRVSGGKHRRDLGE